MALPPDAIRTAASSRLVRGAAQQRTRAQGTAAWFGLSLPLDAGCPRMAWQLTPLNPNELVPVTEECLPRVRPQPLGRLTFCQDEYT